MRFEFKSIVSTLFALPLMGLLVACGTGEAGGAAQRKSSPSRSRRFQPRRVITAQPAIKNAPAIAAKQVRQQVVDTELVIGVVVGGQARAYPINMLTGPSREIINDTLGGKAIAATW